MEKADIRSYYRPGRRVHLVGIGGVSMAPLAEVLHTMGVTVTGSDMQESASVRHLQSLGIPVTIGHLPETVQGADCLVRTAAVHDDNPEIAAALAAGIPVYERGEGWGGLMRDSKSALCISGTHGKTTTTSMCTHIALAAGTDPSVMIGGTLPLLGSGYRIGGDGTMILESCEYYDSFLYFFPTIAVVLDIEADHLDYFKDLDAIKRSFRAFADRIPENGTIIANLDDENTMDALRDETRRVVTFGLEQGDIHAADLVWTRGLPEFDVVADGAVWTHVKLLVPGVHNVKNALAAAAAARVMGLPGEAVRDGLATFRGAARRFQHKGEFNGAQVYDDYAHHPGELQALVDTARTLGYDRIVLAFQPHTYTRTQALFPEFVKILRQADLCLLAEIYAAREQNTTGLSSRDLAEQIPGSVYLPTLQDVTDYLRQIARPGDLILTVGAGNIYTAGEALLKN